MLNQLSLSQHNKPLKWTIQFVESKTRTYHLRFKTGRGEVGLGGARRDAGVCVRPGDNRPSSAPGDRRQLSWTALRKHEQRKSYPNRWRIKTHGWPAVHPRDDGRSLSWLLTSVPSPFFIFVNPSHARHFREFRAWASTGRSDSSRPIGSAQRSPFFGHALHERGLQRQKGDGPLVSSQELRVLLVPMINRG